MQIRMRNLACPTKHVFFVFKSTFFFLSHTFFLFFFKSLGGNPEVINPLCPADLVIDHRFLILSIFTKQSTIVQVLVLL
jgi:hypothetical protein